MVVSWKVFIAVSVFIPLAALQVSSGGSCICMHLLHLTFSRTFIPYSTSFQSTFYYISCILFLCHVLCIFLFYVVIWHIVAHFANVFIFCNLFLFYVCY